MSHPSISNYFISLDEAKTLSKSIKIPIKEEKVKIEDSYNRILSQDIFSMVNDPPFDNSSMDGYAVIYSDTINATEKNTVELEIIDFISAGIVSDKEIKSGYASKIMTGAPIPKGADSIIMIEKTKSSNGKVLLFCPSFPNYIRLKGENITKNEKILEKGTFLTPHEIGILATSGHHIIPVIKKLKITIISTGDELISPGMEISPGQIYESNSYVLEGLIKQIGHIPLRKKSIPDSIEKLREELDQASLNSDLIITSGGVSMGDLDLVRKIMETEGNILFWRIKIKPGSPPLFGFWKDTPLFGLPGNPVSSSVVFQMLIDPWLKSITNAKGPNKKIIKAKLVEKIKTKKDFLIFLRVIVENNGNEMIVYTKTHQGSGNLRSLSVSNGLAIIYPDSEYDVGSIVDIYFI